MIPPQTNAEALAINLNLVVMTIVRQDIIKTNPGKKSSELAGLMGESKKATLNRIKILKSWGRILVKRKTVRRKGNAVHYYKYYIKGAKTCQQ